MICTIQRVLGLLALANLLFLASCATGSPTPASRIPDPKPSVSTDAAASAQEKAPEADRMPPAEEVRLRLEKNPADIDARYARALLLRASGDNEGASAELLALLGTDRNHAPAHATLGTILLESERIAEAGRAFETSLRIDPDNAEAHRGLAQILMANADWQEAVPHLDKALAKDQDPYLYADRAKAWSELGYANRAEPDYALALGMLGNDPFILLDRGRMRARNGKPAEALDDFNLVLKIRPDFTLVHYYRAQVHDQLGMRAKASADLELVLKARGTYAPALEQLAIIRAESGMHTEALGLMIKTWDPLRKNIRSVFLAVAMGLLDTDKNKRENARQVMIQYQPELDQKGLLYQVSRAIVDPSLENYVLGQVQKEPKGNEKFLAQLLMSVVNLRSGLRGAAESLARDCKDQFNEGTTERRILAMVLNEPRPLSE